MAANQPHPSDGPPLVLRAVIDAELLDPARRLANGLPEREDQPGPVIVELNLRHARGLPGAEERFLELYGRMVVAEATLRRPPVEIAGDSGAAT